jgi:hypothetical protein
MMDLISFPGLAYSVSGFAAANSAAHSSIWFWLGMADTLEDERIRQFLF